MQTDIKVTLGAPILLVAALLLPILPGSARAQCRSQLVYPGDDGLLVYVPDAQGNRIPDFSNVGYLGGASLIPDVPVRVTIGPGKGDQTVAIQAAIDQVSQLPIDESGFRGALLLQTGDYPISDHVEITTSGVVLRGQGEGTVLRATGTGQRALVQVKGSGSRRQVGSASNVVDNYVPVGAASFHVDSTVGFALGDTVVVHRPSPGNWIEDIDMHLLKNPWTPYSKNIDWDRRIVDITGNQITIDAPITTALEQQYEGGTIYKYVWPDRIENVGIENLKGQSDFTSPTDEDHSWDFISFVATQNAWVRNVTSQYFAYSLANIAKTAKWVTVADSNCLDPISQITGGRRYSFNVDGQLNLVKNCYAREGRHDFVFGSTVAGPNVFVNSSAERVHADAGPHHRWSSGGLFDNLLTEGELNARNRGNSGSGHGWSGANMVIWNSVAAGFIVESPATAQNWLIGSIGELRPNRIAVGRVYPPILDSHNCPVEPQSLYEAQVAERTLGGYSREYWLGDIDRFKNDGASDQPYVDGAWWDLVASNGLPLIGFDDLTAGAFVPFTLEVELKPGEVLVGAQLSLALRSTGPQTDGGLVYLGSLENAYSYSDLGWLPISDAEGSVRVLDLGGYLEPLQSGKFSLALGADTAVDWVMLSARIAPLP